MYLLIFAQARVGLERVRSPVIDFMLQRKYNELEIYIEPQVREALVQCGGM